MPEKPTLVFDGECAFCRYWADRWRRRTGDRVVYAPFQEAHARFPRISREDFQRSVYLILPDGTAYRGAEAVFRLIEGTSRLGSALLWLYTKAPGFAAVAEWCYSFVARRRSFFMRLMR